MCQSSLSIGMFENYWNVHHAFFEDLCDRKIRNPHSRDQFRGQPRSTSPEKSKFPMDKELCDQILHIFLKNTAKSHQSSLCIGIIENKLRVF